MFTILPLNADNLNCFNQPDARFLASERIQLRFTRKGFLPEYAPLPSAEWRTAKAFPASAETLLNDENAAVYFAFSENKCVGQCVAKSGDHHLCELLDLRTDSRHRRQGVATALLSAMEEWVATRSLAGIRAETSDDQPASCQFFERAGFTLGGVDMLWHHCDPAQSDRAPAMRESVLVFYKFF
ncbi:MAG: GNAT family N-acetyltransferase [Eubacteriales bacterium]|nr:GNAT family N-acetyltransferase [Eubacteriales bacterium]